MTDESGAIATRWLYQALGLKGEETPFPWQLTLLDEFRNGKLRPALDLPTGIGKTSVMAVWLVARALGAPLPRRMVYVVDRRAVVDQATEVAMCLREFVEQTPEVKKQLGISGRSLPISTLRGQYVDNREWLDDPAAPAIIVGTVDMIGSRLLFQGCGVSRKMRPYHAGLLGADTLAVLDEAHLVPAFEALLRDIASGVDLLGPRDKALQTLVPSFSLISLSATGRGSATQAALRLSEEDFNHPIVKRRLMAPKRLFVRNLQKGDELVDALVDEAWRLASDGKRAIRCIVFCNVSLRQACMTPPGITDNVSLAPEGGLTMAQTSPAIPADLQELRERFEDWRRTRRGKSPIPEPLWTAAAQLARSHGVCQTAQVLRLEYKKLKQLTEGGRVRTRVPRRRASAAAAFMELVAPQPAAGAECLIELEGPRGKLRIQWKGATAPDLAALSRVLWESA